MAVRRRMKYHFQEKKVVFFHFMIQNINEYLRSSLILLELHFHPIELTQPLSLEVSVIDNRHCNGNSVSPPLPPLDNSSKDHRVLC